MIRVGLLALERNRPAQWARPCFPWFLCACLGWLGQSALAESLLLTGATVHTVSGDTLAPGQVLVRDGKIAAVGSSVSAPGALTVELRGLHLYPGLVALNTALGLTEIDAVRATDDTTEVGDYTPEVESWVAVNPDSELIPVARASGIVAFEPVPLGGMVSGQSALMNVAGWTTEEMVLKRPIGLHVFWPSMELDTTPPDQASGKPKALEEQARERRARIEALAEFFEQAKAYARAKAASGSGSAAPEQVPAWEAMLPYVRGERPMIVHADELRQIRSALDWARTNQYGIILAGGREAAPAVEALAAQKVPVIYAGTFAQPARDIDSYESPFVAPGILQRAGVRVVFSLGCSSRQAASLFNLPYAAAQAVAFGLPAAEALKGLTLYPAQLAGVADRLGSIEPGKDATLFAADGDILDARAKVLRLWIAGRETSLENRHSRLYQKYRARPKP